jgi:hypothetical protein
MNLWFRLRVAIYHQQLVEREDLTSVDIILVTRNHISVIILVVVVVVLIILVVIIPNVDITPDADTIPVVIKYSILHFL